MVFTMRKWSMNCGYTVLCTATLECVASVSLYLSVASPESLLEKGEDHSRERLIIGP